MIPAGAYGVVRTNDFFGKLIQWATRGKVNHAVLSIGKGWMVEMNPTGASYAPATKYGWVEWFLPTIPPESLPVLIQAADELVDLETGYNFIDIAAQLAYRRLGFRAGALKRFISSPHRMVCSQSVDWCYQEAGIHLFTDGRLPGLVDPQDLYTLGNANPTWKVSDE